MIKNISDPSQFPCSGCGACVSICPQNALSIELDNNGFYTVSVNDNLCVDCGLCKKVCTRYDDSIGGKSLYDVPLFALLSADSETVKKSSSGGIAHELSVQALDNGYKVIGAIYDTETDTVVHKIIDSQDQVTLLDGSKYLQSNAKPALGKALNEAKKSKNNRYLVFGTPCQIAGMAKASEISKVREQFVLVEIFCHGVPSYRVWEEECVYLRKKLKTDKFDSVLFRYKKNDWHSYYLRVDAKGKTYYGARETELFWQVFFENVLLGPACQTCRMRKEDSLSDLRIGDYWGARFEHRSDGVSAVFACTEQGEYAVETLLKNNKLTQLEASDAEEMFSAQNMSGYHNNELYSKTIEVLNETSNVKDAIKFYRSKQSGKQKMKRVLLVLSSIIPDNLRAKLRKANSSRMLKKN